MDFYVMIITIETALCLLIVGMVTNDLYKLRRDKRKLEDENYQLKVSIEKFKHGMKK